MSMVDVSSSSLQSDIQPELVGFGLMIGSHPALNVNSSTEPSDFRNISYSE